MSIIPCKQADRRRPLFGARTAAALFLVAAFLPALTLNANMASAAAARAAPWSYSAGEFHVFPAHGGGRNTVTVTNPGNVTATDTTRASGSATSTWTVDSSGVPPPWFWGNTTAIPPAHNVLEFSIVDRTHGRYEIDRTFCDYYGRNVTWNVDGYLRRIA